MNGLTVRALRVALVMMFLGAVLTQVVVLPWMAWVFAMDYPEVAYIKILMLVVSILTVACAQVVIACIWRLLGMVEGDSIFSEAAFVWVDRMVVAILAACARGLLRKATALHDDMAQVISWLSSSTWMPSWPNGR